MNTVTIICPHCYNQGVHPFNLRPSPVKISGSNRILCENCYKKFRVFFKEGRISSVVRV